MYWCEISLWAMELIQVIPTFVDLLDIQILLPEGVHDATPLWGFGPGFLPAQAAASLVDWVILRRHAVFHPALQQPDFPPQRIHLLIPVMQLGMVKQRGSWLNSTHSTRLLPKTSKGQILAKLVFSIEWQSPQLGAKTLQDSGDRQIHIGTS